MLHFALCMSMYVQGVCLEIKIFVVSGPTSKIPASDGGLCSGELLMMWSAVCSGLPHSHAALSASPHFFIDVMICTDRPQFVVCSESSSVFYTDPSPWCVLLCPMNCSLVTQGL